MNILIAPDSFKGNLTSKEVASAIEKGIRRVLPKAYCKKVFMADGGEGTVAAIVQATDGRMVRKQVTGPLGAKVSARYGLFDNRKRAVLEMAEASGLPLVATDALNPMKTTSYGTGELIRAAVIRGVQDIILGIGGSATNDGGMGMAQALGVRFFDKRNRLIIQQGCGGILHRVHRIDLSNVIPELSKTTIRIASDVTNPLCGPRGASVIYGPQKGATPAMVKKLDNHLRAFAQIIHRDLGMNLLRMEGAGAAGGLGAGLVAFAGAKMSSGVDLVMEVIRLETHVAKADLVITGEGSVDRQTAYGKTPSGVARLARKHHVPVIAIGGSTAQDAHQIFDHGIDGVADCVERPMPLECALAMSKITLANCAERLMRFIMIGQRMHLKH